MKRIILLFFFMMVSAFPSSNSDYLTHLDIINFEKHWITFLRDKYGCPKTEGTVYWERCNPKIGGINVKEYNEARKYAKRIFELVDKEKDK